ncbi:sulfite exporter TauE/SafE family protein [Chlorogloeopsis sp. ULAP01]|uniref:sulfite exporter TauE/SafE family protein n=1 Tax=Chlorogloeopsis sp. ULAP01 TaxID=3056483 RepID=UPI0025AA890B|nr:sulfite exporter TauE/SafE family protein [Chlorogloeopsis sp. ULAP01]MDM9384058.1 sulfite exporter TauE/SafE family protein [Chlorogloeopsis sp. ULAP01]
MTLAQAGFLLTTAIIGGALTAIAGGGGFVLFPALIFAGLPSINANATATVAGWLGCGVSLAAYRDELSAQRRISVVLGSISLIGATVGAVLLIYTPTVAFDRLVPYLLLFSTLLFAGGGKITSWLHSHLGELNQASWRSLIIASFIQFFIAVYGGFYGAGVAILILAALEMLGMKDIHKMNALKMLLMTCMSSFAVITFAIAGVIVWQPAILMMLGTIIGGYGGAYYARRLKQHLIKHFVIVVGFLMTCYFFIR